jgi:DNA ligase-associated metallophosphoesterase
MNAENHLKYTLPDGQQLILLPQRAVWWPELSVLIVADTHFGKTGTFRQGGIPAPRGVDESDLLRLGNLIASVEAKRCIILGDLFHSIENTGWELLDKWTSDQSDCTMELVPGNHDILPAQRYKQAGLLVHNPQIALNGVRLVHDPDEPVFSDLMDCTYTLSGHIHPGARLSGRARQTMMVPCYFMGATFGILPAFGQFTGLSLVHPGRNDQIFAVGGEGDTAFVAKISIRK